jgi:hypothetical protein
MSTPFTSQEILAIVVAASFAAGMNVYATILVLGLLARFDLTQLPANLHVLESWWTIGAAGALYALEFVADKIPGVDLIWGALQTFVRVPVAGLLAFGATGGMSPGAQLASAALASAIALVAHGGKMALRTTVTASPEPVSNIALSLAEDAAAIGLTWFATRHPYLAAAIAAALLVAVLLLIRAAWRTMVRWIGEARAQWRRWRPAS